MGTEKSNHVLKCNSRISGYQPIHIEGGEFANKLIRHVHENIKHLGVANTLATVREGHWIPHLRAKVKKVINDWKLRCARCSVQNRMDRQQQLLHCRRSEPKTDDRTRPQGSTTLNLLPIRSQRRSKANAMLIFTCGMSRAIRLKVTKSQRAEELKEKLNAFITRCTRPKCIVSDNGPVFRTTAAWIKKNRKSVMLQDYFARQQFTGQFNLSKSPRLGGLYKILIKDAKKTFYKTMGRTSLKYEEVNLW